MSNAAQSRMPRLLGKFGKIWGAIEVPGRIEIFILDLALNGGSAGVYFILRTK